MKGLLCVFPFRRDWVSCPFRKRSHCALHIPAGEAFSLLFMKAACRLKNEISACLSFERLKGAFMCFTLQAALEHVFLFENVPMLLIYTILSLWLSAEGTFGTFEIHVYLQSYWELEDWCHSPVCAAWHWFSTLLLAEVVKCSVIGGAVKPNMVGSAKIISSLLHKWYAIDLVS